MTAQLTPTELASFCPRCNGSGKAQTVNYQDLQTCPECGGDGKLRPQWWREIVREKAELDARLKRLVAFVESQEFSALHEDEQARISKQAGLMLEYSYVLDQRIRACGG